MNIGIQKQKHFEILNIHKTTGVIQTLDKYFAQFVIIWQMILALARAAKAAGVVQVRENKQKPCMLGCISSWCNWACKEMFYFFKTWPTPSSFVAWRTRSLPLAIPARCRSRYPLAAARDSNFNHCNLFHYGTLSRNFNPCNLFHYGTLTTAWDN